MALEGPELDEALAGARRAVAEAAALLRGVHGGGERIEAVQFKTNELDPVTAWDLRVEELLRERLTRLTPTIPIVGEEGGAGPDLGPGARAELRWLIDPIDGTVNFLHGLPLFGVTASLEERGRPVAGVIAAPALGWEAWGRRGGGAFCEAGRMKVSATDRVARAMVATGFPYDRATSRKNFAAWDHFQVIAHACRRLGAASLDMLMVARGWLDGYWEADIEAWDLSAGALLVEEAGGRVTDLTGGPFVSDTGRALATNGAIHEEMLHELETVKARESQPGGP